MKAQSGEGVLDMVLYGVQGQAKRIGDFHVLIAPVQQLQHSLFRLSDTTLELRVADDVLMTADASQGALNVFKVEQGVGVDVLNVVDAREVTLAEVLNDPELVISKVRFAAFVLIYQVCIRFRIEVLNILNHEADHFPAGFFEPMWLSVMIHVPDLILEGIKLYAFHSSSTGIPEISDNITTCAGLAGLTRPAIQFLTV